MKREPIKAILVDLYCQRDEFVDSTTRRVEMIMKDGYRMSFMQRLSFDFTVLVFVTTDFEELIH